MHEPNQPTGGTPGRWAVIVIAVLGSAAAFAYAGGWLTPHRLTPKRMVDQLQQDSGLHPGYRRNHAKGVCVAGYFESNGQAQPYSRAQVFASGRTPVMGRFAIPGGDPTASDSSAPIRSLALRFTQADGQQWRTGMLTIPVFLVATPKQFYDQAKSSAPDPATGKPDPDKVKAFFASNPDSAPFLAWVKTAKPSASYVTENYWGLNAFYFVNANGARQAVRWQLVSEVPGVPADAGKNSGEDYLATDLTKQMAAGPQRWHLKVILANPGDPTNDASKAWPSDRKEIDAGTLVLDQAIAQDAGPCRDINYDPLVLPNGIEASDDPLLPARSAAYADSYLRRTSEEAHLPGSAAAPSKPENN